MIRNGRNDKQLLIAFAAAVLLLSPVALAAEDDDFELNIEPISFEVLESEVDTDSSKFQEYRDLSSGFRLPLLLLDGYGLIGDPRRLADGESEHRSVPSAGGLDPRERLGMLRLWPRVLAILTRPDSGGWMRKWQSGNWVEL